MRTVASIQNRTRTLVNALRSAKNEQSRLLRLEEFNEHVLKYPTAARSQAFRDKALPSLLLIRQKGNKEVKREARKSLALLGWVDPVKSQGIRILSIDGGGSRGLISIEILKKLEEYCHKEIHELFDFICGSSTGAILAFLLGIKKLPLEECEVMYRKLSIEIFERNTLLGTGKLFWTHSFYDTNKFAEILKEEAEDKRLIDSASDCSTPKVAAISTLVNHTILKPYVFRNYTLPYGSDARFLGGCHYKQWEALRASTAAPGFFEECKLHHDIHQDGGLLTNNPCAVAIHEAHLLWPTTPFQCIVSLGTGRYQGRAGPLTKGFTSVREKLLKVVASATDTEAVDTVLRDLLPKSVYYRFNPNMAGDIPMDENRAEILEQLQADARSYTEKNHVKLKTAAAALLRKKGSIQHFRDRIKLWYAAQ